mmetsp:Transcript_12958/g.35536  ORF Transcript_12958/g.35536 Transcript_12958/m.35536 type:complete len:231 (-) Transcript_12958:193-885(-)
MRLGGRESEGPLEAVHLHACMEDASKLDGRVLVRQDAVELLDALLPRDVVDVEAHGRPAGGGDVGGRGRPLWSEAPLLLPDRHVAQQGQEHVGQLLEAEVALLVLGQRLRARLPELWGRGHGRGSVDLAEERLGLQPAGVGVRGGAHPAALVGLLFQSSEYPVPHGLQLGGYAAVEAGVGHPRHLAERLPEVQEVHLSALRLEQLEEDRLVATRPWNEELAQVHGLLPAK